MKKLFLQYGWVLAFTALAEFIIICCAGVEPLLFAPLCTFPTLFPHWWWLAILVVKGHVFVIAILITYWQYHKPSELLPSFLHAGFTFWLLFVLLIVCVFSDGSQSIDDVTLFNPVYNYLHTGQLVYPIHGYNHSISVHPPMHYFVIAVLMKMGLGLRLAQSFLLMLFVIGIMWWSWVSSSAFFLRVSVLAALVWLLQYASIQIRPDYTIACGLLLGSLCLSEFLLRKQDIGWLVIGTALVSFCSLLHYYAWPGMAMLGVVWGYMYWYFYSQNRFWQIKVSVALSAIIIVPYFLFIFLPDLGNIKTAFSANQVHMNLPLSVCYYFDTMRFITNNSPMLGRLTGFWLFSWHIPLFIASACLSIVYAPARKILMLWMPYYLALLLFATHKLDSYIIPEVFLFVVCFFATGLFLITQTLSAEWRNAVISLGIVAMLCLTLNKGQVIADANWHPVAQSNLARWCGAKIHGGAAVASGTNGVWYISGAKDFYLTNNNDFYFDSLIDKGHAGKWVFADGPDISSGGQKVFAQHYTLHNIHLLGFWGNTNAILNPYLLFSSQAAFSSGYSYLGKAGLFRYLSAKQPSDFYYYAFLAPANLPANLLSMAPEFSHKFVYSMKDADGKELYTGILGGKKLIWGVAHKDKLNILLRDKRYQLIDTICVAPNRVTIPTRVSTLHLAKPAVRLLPSFKGI